ncbi:DNA topoisomerase VI subunit B [Candidatus Woesearchaeota archaeon B3_Woes]|nr:MAG: DNA topoisomerase VI subunit B [Candidatus Woesearchaeota archaeon B3_Woes]
MANSNIAEEMAKKQRDISVASFFEKNRHLLGFDNKRKALLTVVKEAVDNSIDACEEADILPEISIELIDLGNDKFRIIIEDNGPGIVKKQIPPIFAKLLYGSKFHNLSQTRGQQGIGISAAVMYSQLTTGKPTKITSKVKNNSGAHYYELHIDIAQNKPDIIKDESVDWNKDHGVKIEMDLEGNYQGGSQSVDQYLKETAIVNPHITIIYTNPKAEQTIFARATDNLPKKPVEIKPHPYGIELGMLMRMAKDTESRTLQSFLTNDFSRVGSGTAKQICENAALLPNTKPRELVREMAEKLMEGIKKTKIISPPTDCISPISSEELEKGLKKEINAEFYYSITRPPSVYRGNPFIVEAGLAYGGDQSSEGSITLMRFANRVPLLYQQSACAAAKSVVQTNWRKYGLSQSSGALPQGPLTVVVHIASVWVPFTSESKEAIAHYPEIIKEIKLALQEIGRKLGSYVHKKKRVLAEGQKRDYIKTYIPHVAEALKELVGFKDADEKKVEEYLTSILEKQRGKLENLEVVNEEYDEELAKIGKDNKEEQKTLGEEEKK